MRPLFGSALAVLICAFPAVDAAAQANVRQITGAPTCADCTLQRYRIATITDRGYPPGAIVMMAGVSIATDSSFFVAAGPGLMSELYRAGRDGRITHRVGRPGDGPGEYRAPWFVTEAQSSYYIWDTRHPRITRLDTRDLGTLGTTPLAVVPLEPPRTFRHGRHLINTDAGDPAAPVLHIISSEGEVIRSFESRGRRGGRQVALMGDSLVLSVSRADGYLIKAHDTLGVLRTVYERPADWFPPLEKGADPGDGDPRIMHLHAEDGLLWVMIGVIKRRPDENFLAGPFWDRSESQVIVEVLDLDRASVVASASLPGFYASPGRTGFVSAFPRMTDTQEHVVDIFGYRLLPRR